MQLKLRQFKLSDKLLNMKLHFRINSDVNYKNCFRIRISYSWNHHLDVEYEDILLDISKGATVRDLKRHINLIDLFSAMMNAYRTPIDIERVFRNNEEFRIFHGIEIPVKRKVAYNRFNSICQEIMYGEMRIAYITYYDKDGTRYDINPAEFEWQNPKQNSLSNNRLHSPRI